MTLWTIQSIAAWKTLQREQVLFTDQRYSEEVRLDAYQMYLDAYQWMVKQMERRIGPRPENASLPLWAWYQRHNSKKRKPDLRFSRHLPQGERGVRIEFEQSDKEVLLSDFVLWHHVLNDVYLPRTIAEGEAFYDELEAKLSKHNLSFSEGEHPLVRAYHQRIEKSWDRIFDLDCSEDITDPFDKKIIQATFWQLHLDQIRDVQFFTAR